jgi:prepilin-type processing-associated H-X9-DG protein
MNACVKIQRGYNYILSNEREDVMPKINPLTFDDLNAVLAYDRNTGVFTWRVKIARNVAVGDQAGSLKGVRVDKNGRSMRYMYIRYNNFEMPAARVAWLLHNGKWPDGNVLFVDGNSENLRIDNLREQVTNVDVTDRDGIKQRKMDRASARNYGLKRYYGISLATYDAMLASQNGVCAICAKSETGKIPSGEIKPFSVDHNHKTGEIRGLLCTQCNYMIGHCRESREILLAGIAYLDKHEGVKRAAPKLEIVRNEETQ